NPAMVVSVSCLSIVALTRPSQPAENRTQPGSEQPGRPGQGRIEDPFGKTESGLGAGQQPAALARRGRRGRPAVVSLDQPGILRELVGRQLLREVEPRDLVVDQRLLHLFARL